MNIGVCLVNSIIIFFFAILKYNINELINIINNWLGIDDLKLSVRDYF